MNYLKRLMPYFRPNAQLLALLTLAIVGGLVMGVATPWVLGLVVDEGIAKLDLSAVTLYCVLLVAVTALRSLFSYAQGVWQGTIGANIVRDLRDALYRKLQALPFSWYARMPTGQIMSRMMSDLDAVEQFVSFGFAVLVSEGMTLVFTLVVCMFLDWQLTLLVLLPFPFLLGAIIRFRSRIDPAHEAIRAQMGKLTAVLQENVSGVRVVKAFARERFAIGKFGAENALNRDKSVYRAKLEADYFPSADFFSSLSWVILVLAGALRLIDGTLTPGAFFAFNWYIWSLIWPLRSVGFLVNIMRGAAAAAPRLFEIADAQETIADPPAPRPAPPAEAAAPGRVEFRDVHFSFPDDPATPVLRGLSFTVEPGQTVAILGGTGSGKSSVINLVPRFYDVTVGQVLVDGVDVREMALGTLRARIGIVPQETFLFSASLKDNIAFGKPGAAEEEVVAAAQVAQVHEFASKLPKGYATKVGERGVGLSGGQKQRVALARAVLMDPRVLILDEATSAVDTATEAQIQQAMAEVMRGRTSIVVAQRLSTVLGADRVVVLKDGRVAEQGTHETLYALGGEYRALYDLQLAEQARHDEIDEDMLLREPNAMAIGPNGKGNANGHGNGHVTEDIQAAVAAGP